MIFFLRWKIWIFNFKIDYTSILSIKLYSIDQILETLIDKYINKLIESDTIKYQNHLLTSKETSFVVLKEKFPKIDPSQEIIYYIFIF